MSLEQSIQDLITASGQQTEAANQLSQTVADKVTAIDAEVQAKKAEIDAYLVEASEHIPLVRLSPNQFGNIDDATKNLQGWSKNSAFTIEVSLLDTIPSNIPYANRPAAHQEILDAMGHQSEHFFPDIRVLKMIWSGWTPVMNGHTIYPGTLPIHRHGTTASYARVVAGSIGQNFLSGVTENWGLCGATFDGHNGYYRHIHPYVSSSEGEVHFIWPALAEGHVELDRNNPSWAWMPSMFGTGFSDTIA